MKVLLIVTALVMSLSASAFEIKTGNLVLPERVKDTIHAKLEELCSSDVNSVDYLELVSHEVNLVRVDQGYKENQYNLKFKVVYTPYAFVKKDNFTVMVVDQLEDRSGELQTYVLKYRTTACN